MGWSEILNGTGQLPVGGKAFVMETVQEFGEKLSKHLEAIRHFIHTYGAREHLKMQEEEVATISVMTPEALFKWVMANLTMERMTNEVKSQLAKAWLLVLRWRITKRFLEAQ
ncbi:MAG: hypothetical protein ISS36_00950 [Candidatus Aenigmarchaeota archaeon]|nr:hypothetical protein [Candidatus Aenigmarchaeota archaeon]